MGSRGRRGIVSLEWIRPNLISDPSFLGIIKDTVHLQHPGICKRFPDFQLPSFLVLEEFTRVMIMKKLLK